MRSADCGPKIASSVSRLLDFNASTSVLAASSGEAKVFGVAWVCCSGAFCELEQEHQHKIVATTTSPTHHRATLDRFVSISQSPDVPFPTVPRSGRYLRPPPPRNPPPPQPPPPPRLPQPRELEERSPQPLLAKLDPEWSPYPLNAVEWLPE